MGFFKKRNQKTLDNIFDKDSGLLAKVGAHIGNKKFTDEERRESDIKELQMMHDFVKTSLDENSERSKSRRGVAIMWIQVQLLMFILTAIAAPFDKELAKFYLELATNPVLLMGTTGIIGFFFGTHLLRSKQPSGKSG
jgi:hypothetical protein